MYTLILIIYSNYNISLYTYIANYMQDIIHLLCLNLACDCMLVQGLNLHSHVIN